MAAGITLAIGIIAPDWAGVDSDPFERVSFFIVSFFATSFVGAVAILPALVVIVIAEAARLRNFLYYGVGGGAGRAGVLLRLRCFHAARKHNRRRDRLAIPCSSRRRPGSLAGSPIG